MVMAQLAERSPLVPLTRGSNPNSIGKKIRLYLPVDINLENMYQLKIILFVTLPFCHDTRQPHGKDKKVLRRRIKIYSSHATKGQT